MEFSEVLQRLEVESGRGRGHVPADWQVVVVYDAP